MPLVNEMLKKALKTLGKDVTPMLHLNQGWQYQMVSYQRQFAARGLTQSMTSRVNCLGNAAMEGFFGMLK
jgi:putative transposase